MGSTQADPADVWDAHAEEWSGTVQEVTLAPCTALLKDTSAVVPFGPHVSRVLDSGAGSGQLVSILKSQYPDVPVVASEISKGMIKTLQQRSDRLGWKNVETIVQDCQNLASFSDASFSHAYCTFVMSFTQHPEKAIQEMYRVLKPGGVAGISTWAVVCWVAHWEYAVRKVQGSDDYQAPTMYHDGTMKVEWMKSNMQQSGFTDVTVKPFKCYKPLMSTEEGVDLFYGTLLKNPGIQTLVKGFDGNKDFMEKTKPYFAEAFDKATNGGKIQQYETALLVVGQKPQ